MMVDIQLSTPLIFCTIIPLFFLILSKLLKRIQESSTQSSPRPNPFPKSYPIIGSFFSLLKNNERFSQWTSEIVKSTPNLTFTLNLGFGRSNVVTANPANVEHVLKTNFHNYVKGGYFTTTMRDFLGDGIFNVDGEKWKFQRQVSIHEFNTKSLRKFVETVVDSEVSGRLIPILKDAAANKKVLDFQDILQRFGFDNICKIAFGYDPALLSPSLPEADFTAAFENALILSTRRFRSLTPYYWKIKRALNIGSEKQLKILIRRVRDSAREIIKEKKRNTDSIGSMDLLSRFMSSGHVDEDLAIDIVISMILAGRDTTSVALTWFFWLLSKNPDAENEILKEIEKTSEDDSALGYDEVKGMVYTHASLCESMRLYPPVPVDAKAAESDDFLPDGTVVKKGVRVVYHPYAMGRVEKVWGRDWAEFRPERWLEREEGDQGKWRFVNKDSYTYPVFQAGPRICLGKEMSFLQMKKIVAAVLRRYRVVPALEGGKEPVMRMSLTARMQDGFPVRIEHRN
uniref:Cytochrome P450 n=1 Tax=Scoparia dulcis TaxID=107240 RepID=A0A1W7HBP1_SCODU